MPFTRITLSPSRDVPNIYMLSEDRMLVLISQSFARVLFTIKKSGLRARNRQTRNADLTLMLEKR